MFKSVREYIQKFRKEIRRESIEQIKHAKRQVLLNQIATHQVLSLFRPHAAPNQIDTIQDVFQYCHEMLMNPFVTHEIMGEDSRIDVKVQTEFLKAVHKSFNDGSFNSKILHDFIIGIMSKHTCEAVQQYPKYQHEFYQLVQLTVDSFTEYSHQILKWVSSQRSLWLIEKLTIQQIINPNTHPNIFLILQQALASNEEALQANALRFLSKILRYSDQQDLSLIYHKHFTILQLIINAVSTKIGQKCFQLIEYWPPLLDLLSTNQEEALKGYAKTGLIAICGSMISTNTEPNIIGGLQILIHFSAVQSLLDFLLLDQEIEDSKMWLISCLRNDIYQHSSRLIRKSFASVIRNVFKTASSCQLETLCRKFLLKGHSFAAWLEWVLEQDEDSQVKIMGLMCLERLLLEEGQQINQLSSVFSRLTTCRVIASIEGMQYHSQEQVRELCVDILQRMDELKRKEPMEEV